MRFLMWFRGYKVKKSEKSLKVRSNCEVFLLCTIDWIDQLKLHRTTSREVAVPIGDR